MTHNYNLEPSLEFISKLSSLKGFEFLLDLIGRNAISKLSCIQEFYHLLEEEPTDSLSSDKFLSLFEITFSGGYTGATETATDEFYTPFKNALWQYEKEVCKLANQMGVTEVFIPTRVKAQNENKTHWFIFKFQINNYSDSITLLRNRAPTWLALHKHNVSSNDEQTQQNSSWTKKHLETNMNNYSQAFVVAWFGLVFFCVSMLAMNPNDVLLVIGFSRMAIQDLYSIATLISIFLILDVFTRFMLFPYIITLFADRALAPILINLMLRKSNNIMLEKPVIGPRLAFSLIQYDRCCPLCLKELNNTLKNEISANTPSKTDGLIIRYKYPFSFRRFKAVCLRRHQHNENFKPF